MAQPLSDNLIIENGIMVTAEREFYSLAPIIFNPVTVDNVIT